MSNYRVELLVPATPDYEEVWAAIRDEPGDSFETARYWVRWFREKNEEYGGDNSYRLVEISETVTDT